MARKKTRTPRLSTTAQGIGGVKIEPQHGRHAQTCHQIGFHGLGEKAKMGKAEAVIHGFVEIDTGAPAVVQTVPPEGGFALLFPPAGGGGAAGLLGFRPLHQSGGLLRFCHGVLIEIRVDVPDEVYHANAAQNQQPQADTGAGQIALHDEGSQPLQPAPEGDPPAESGVEEFVGGAQNIQPTGLEEYQERGRQHEHSGVDPVAQMLFEPGVGGADGVQQNLEQLPDQDGAEPGDKNCRRPPSGEPQIQDQVRQLEYNVNGGNQRHSQLGGQPEHENGLGLHGRGEEQIHIGGEKNPAAVFIRAHCLEEEQKQNRPARNQLCQGGGGNAQGEGFFLFLHFLFFRYDGDFHGDFRLPVCFYGVLQGGGEETDDHAQEQTDRQKHQHPGFAELAYLIDEAVQRVISK